MTVVAANHISKSYGNKAAVEDLTLKIESGTMFGLLGPNGAGKTSTIRMLIGMTRPDSGSVSLFNEPFHRRLLRRVGYLPEERGLYRKMKVLDQLAFLGQLHGLEKATATQRAKDWCERLQISASLNSVTEELSKGMQQKIQFIATLLHEPDLIIMDEPFSGLDPVNASLLRDVLLDLKKAGRAIIFSTHRMEQVEKLCDTICLIDSGRIVLSGGVREVKSRYKRNRLIVEFEGDGSFLQHAAIADFRNFPGHTEIHLKDGADSQALLHAAAEKASVYRFDLMEPSLEDIFIQTIGASAYA
jgi:ABC-2 type transport system ATP-binding protein